jgi:tetratricopeptide (TPR) repeat protein
MPAYADPDNSSESQSLYAIRSDQHTVTDHETPRYPRYKSIHEYNRQLAMLEESHGAYEPGLEEVLLGLGQAYQADGMHQQAIGTLKRALHINRVNYGLYDIRKAPLIERLIDSYAATGDWEAVDHAYYRLTQLGARNYDNTDIELLPILRKLVKWHIFAYEQNLSEEAFDHLSTARSLLATMAGIIEIHYGSEDLRLIDPLSGIALTNYYLALTQASERMSNLPSRDFRTGLFIEPEDNRMLMVNTYSDGREKIERMIHINSENEQAPDTAELDALIKLGDWHLLFNKKQRAEEVYQQLWQNHMHDDQKKDYLVSAFQQPVALPDFTFREFEPLDNSLPGNPTGTIMMEFDVTEVGRSVNVKVIDTDPPATTGAIISAKRQLKATRFRPRYENGVAVETTGMQYRYSYETKPEQAESEAEENE